MIKLFSTKTKEFLEPVHKSEGELNKFLAENWKHFFSQYTFIKNEFTLEGSVRSKGGSGRIDILAFNPKTNKFVVFELKRELDKNIINQVSDYRDFVEDNFAEIYLRSTQTHDIALPKYETILKDSSEVILIAKKFAPDDLEKARKSKYAITLIRYLWFESQLLIEYLNNDPEIEKIPLKSKPQPEPVGGKAISILKQGERYKQLFDSGMNTGEIANKYGYTREHIRNCIKLAEAPTEIKEAVEKDEISPTAAIRLIKNVDSGKVVELFNKAKQKIKAGKMIQVKDIQEII